MPVLTADNEGVWWQDGPARRSGIAWNEVHSASGSKLDCKTHHVTVVTLDWENGEYFELMNNWEGFDEVVSQFSSRLSGLAPDWIARVESLTPYDNPIVVWKRA